MARRHPLAAVLMTVVAGSAALTLGISAISQSATAENPANVRTAGHASSAGAGTQDVFHNRVNQIMGLAESTLQPIDVLPGLDGEGQLSIILEGEPVTIVYWPHSVRAAGYGVLIQVEGGALIEVDSPPVNTVLGFVQENPAISFAGSVQDDGLHGGFNMPDGRLLWIEPIASHVPGVDPSWHVLYDNEDADCDGGTCGVPQAWLNQAQGHDGDGEGPMPSGADNCQIAEIAFDVDLQYFQAFGSNVNNVINNVNAIVNAINSNQYTPQTGIIHEITQIVIRTTAGENPYTTNNPSSLLGQFQNVWNTPPESSIPRDLAHLLTGRNLSGSVIGIAFLGRVCILNEAYGLSQRITPFSCMTDLVAHEVGHNWNAGHCSCPSSTMNASLTCANTFTGSGSNSINQILNHKNSRTCLHPCVPPPPPDNNTCQDRIVVTDGSTPFSNQDATTEGPDEPDNCTFLGNTQINNDVWFEYTATCTGEMTVSLCDSSILTKLGIYAGSVCPTQPDTVDACDVISCPNGRSTITMKVSQGENFIIRAGARTTQMGDGILDIVCEEVSAPDCPEDLNGDGVVNVADLLILFEAWGSCPGCPEDLNGDDIVNVADLLILFEAWGDCP
jgi:hypothetical protein